MPFGIPPFCGGFLIGSDAEVAAATGDEVAGDGGFEIEARLHWLDGSIASFLRAAAVYRSCRLWGLLNRVSYELLADDVRVNGHFIATVEVCAGW